MASEGIGKLIWHYSLPAITGTVVMSLFNIVDRIFIGQGVGPLALSGLALTFPFMNVLTSFGMLVGNGAAARISISLGEGDHAKAERILAHAFVLTFMVTGTAIGLSLAFMDDILTLFGGTERTIRYAEEYMRIIIPFACFSALSYSFNSIMRATGYPRQAMWTMIICALVNVVLDPLFIFGFGWGIAGAAWATNVAYAVGAAWVLVAHMNLGIQGTALATSSAQLLSALLCLLYIRKKLPFLSILAVCPVINRNRLRLQELNRITDHCATLLHRRHSRDAVVLLQGVH